MTQTFKGNRKTLEVDENDVVLIFKEDGHVDLSFPELIDDNVPDHVMAALALSYAVVDEEFFSLIQERFAEQASLFIDEDGENKETPKNKQDDEEAPPHLWVVS